LPSLRGVSQGSRSVKALKNKVLKGNNPNNQIYLKAMALNDFSDVNVVKSELNLGNIVILKVTPLAKKNIEDVKRVVNELCDFVKSISGDIARLGEERIVITSSDVRIWRENMSG
jgi:SepF-like predicted cell division protein (DUF552 family)